MWRNVLFSLQHRCTRSPRRWSTDDSPQMATGCGWVGGGRTYGVVIIVRAAGLSPGNQNASQVHTRNRTTAAGAMTHSESTCTIILLKYYRLVTVLLCSPLLPRTRPVRVPSLAPSIYLSDDTPVTRRQRPVFRRRMGLTAVRCCHASMAHRSLLSVTELRFFFSFLLSRILFYFFFFVNRLIITSYYNDNVTIQYFWNLVFPYIFNKSLFA